MQFDPKYTVADVRYFRRAVRYMTRKFPRDQLVFVVCSDDLHWSKQNFPDAVSREVYHVTVGRPSNASVAGNRTRTNSTSAVVVFSERHGAEEDLAILGACNHTIMTVGTYGWWAGYLTSGITIYYRNFPSRYSELWQWFSREDHFPPHWIGL